MPEIWKSRGVIPFYVLCMCLNVPEVLPYFVRAKLNKMLAEGLSISACQDDEGDVWEALELPIGEFARRVEAKTLPEDFYMTDWVMDEFLTDNHCRILVDTSLEFYQMPWLTPPKSLIMKGLVPDWLDKNGAVIYLCRRQPAAFNNGPIYKDANECIAEVKGFLSEYGVELPKDFPYWNVVGTLANQLL